jgi:hypothetical protein
MQAVQSRLSAYQHALSRWSWRKFGNGEEQLRMKTKQLVDLQKNESPENIETIKCLQAEIDGIIEREDIKWNKGQSRICIKRVTEIPNSSTRGQIIEGKLTVSEAYKMRVAKRGRRKMRLIRPLLTIMRSCSLQKGLLE